jgi:hypothetical protein
MRVFVRFVLRNWGSWTSPKLVNVGDFDCGIRRIEKLRDEWAGIRPRRGYQGAGSRTLFSS